MHKLFAVFLLLLFFSHFSHAQTLGSVKGVVSSNGEKLPFVHLKLKGTSFGTVTDEEGSYLIENLSNGKYTIVASAVGFLPFSRDFQIVNGERKVIEIVLKKSLEQLEEVVVTGTLKETYLSRSPVKIEVLTQKFLASNPASNIMEALQTVNGVQEQINCGVCGTNDIHINGMEGPYTLVLIDGMPIVSALASVYGFNGIPLSLIERVEIVKGPSSTLYGTEAVGGVINIITKDVDVVPDFAFNSYYTSHREWNLDASTVLRTKGGTKGLLSANFFRNQYRMDFNEDNFTDVPLNERVSLFNKWEFRREKGRKANLALRYYNENRFGGVLQWQEGDRGSNEVYGESIYTDRVEVIGSYQLPAFNDALRIDYSLNRHAQDSYYGDTYYRASQWVSFANLIWNKNTGRHDFVIGGTARHQSYEDNSLANTDQVAFIPGLFVQDEFSVSERSTILAGSRLDFHRNHGAVFAPRLNYKYNFSESTTLRANLGTGFRLVHLFTEDHAALTGSRTVLIKENLQPETSYNGALSLHHLYTIGEDFGNFDVDVFYTYFTNKIIPDYETDENLIIYDNLSGHGITRGGSFSIDHSFSAALNLRLGFTVQDVFQVSRDSVGRLEKQMQIFAPFFSGTFGIRALVKRWDLEIDYGGRVMGPQHLPTFEEPHSRPDVSPWFTIQNFKLTKRVNAHFTVFAGVKNIWNYTQRSPLINPENPFSDAFDTSYAYGPLQVRRFLVGVQYTLSNRDRR